MIGQLKRRANVRKGMLFRETFDLVIHDRKTQTTRPLEWYLWYKDKVGA